MPLKNAFHWKTILRLAGWFLLFIYMFLAIALTIVRFWALPNIEKLYPTLETYLEEQLHTQIQVDSIYADWQFFVPRLTVTNMTLSRPGEKASLTLPKVQVTFSLESLFKLRPITRRIVIIDPDLHIERLSKNIFNIGGFTVDTAAVPTSQKSNSEFFDGQSETPAVFEALLDQRHIEINNGHFSYIDHTEASPHSVQLVNTNLLLHRYAMAWTAGIQSTLIGKEKTYLDVRVRFQETLLGEKNRLHNLYGTVYANIPEVNFGLIADRLNLDQFVHRGHGKASVWMTFADLRPTSITTDISLDDVSVRWTPQSKPFEFDSFQGRIEQTLSDNNFLKIKSRDLIIKPRGKSPYYLGNLELQGFIKDGTFFDGQMNLDFFDLQALSTIGLQLPIPQKGLQAIRQLNAHGLIDNFESSWRGDITNPNEYDIRLNFKGLTISGIPTMPGNLAQSGFKNLSGRLELNQGGGHFVIDSPSSQLTFPGIFPEPSLTFDTLKLNGRWNTGSNAELTIEELLASNRDTSLQLHGKWLNTGDLGTLEVRGDIHYLDARSAYRYIPLVAGGWGTNNWLKGALQGGIARNAKVDVYGPLREFPFHKSTNPNYIFKIEGDIENAKLDYLPSMKKDSKGQWIPGPWPWIDQIHGRITFIGDGMTVRAHTGRAQGGALLQNVTASIPSYGAHGVPLVIKGYAQAPLRAMADYVNHSPVSAMIGHPFEKSTLRGDAQLELDLYIPITEVHNTKVNGAVHLANNFVHLNNVPPLDKANGTVTFSEKGVWSPKLTAEVYGKSATGSINTDTSGKIIIAASGMADATMVAKIINSPASTSLLDFVKGETNANVRVELHKGIRVHVESSLTGAYTQVPEPFNKTKEEAWPVVFDMEPCANKKECDNRMRLSIRENLLKMAILYSGTDRGLKATRGYFAINTPVESIPDYTGLSLYINTKKLVWSEWQDAIDHILKQQEIDPNADLKTMTLNRVVTNFGYLDYNGMVFNHVKVNVASNRQQAWSGSLSSNLFNGQFSWTPGTSNKHPQLKAHFDYLTIPQKTLVDKTLKLVPKTTDSLPSLTLGIDRLKYVDYDLGALTISAKNSGFGENQAWILDSFEVKTKEAKLAVNGIWDSGKKQKSQTTLNATLDVSDIGDLLERAHYQQVINSGRGQVNAKLKWNGAPVDFNTSSLHGQISTQLLSGQITQVEPGAGRLMSLMSLQQLLRRFALDFRDVVGRGFVFDSINGTVEINNGLATTDSLRIIGPQATILSQGWLDLNTLTQKVKISVLPDISLGGASVALAVANPLLGVGSFLAQLALQAPLSQLFSVEYEVSGTVDKPVIQKVGDQSRTATASQAP